MSYLNIQNHNQQAYPSHRPVKNNYIPPPPFDPSLYDQSNSRGAAFKQYHQQPFYSPYNQPQYKQSSQRFFEPIYKVPPPNFDQEQGNEEVKDIASCQAKKLHTQTKQKSSFQNPPVNIQVAEQENLPQICNKGIFKIKLGAVYTKKNRIPDDYSCFIQMIESIFPCLSPDFKQPLLGLEQLDAQELEQKAISQIVNQENDQFYKVFYFNADDKPIMIKNAQDYNDLNWQLANNKSLLHPTHGLKMFIIPKQGDSFLHRFSLGGEREVELTQQLWKLLFTDNNYIFNLRQEKPIKKAADINSDNVGQMREFLVGQLEESLEAVNISDDDDDADGQEEQQEGKRDIKDDKNCGAQKEEEVKRQLIELDEYSIIDRISQANTSKRVEEEQAENEGIFQQNIKVEDQKREELEQKQKNQEFIQINQNQQQAKVQEKKEEKEGDNKNQSSSDLDEEDIRTLIRQRIDTECRALILQHFKNYDQDCKLEEIEDIIRSRLFVNRQQDQEIDSIPDINFQEVNYSQIKDAEIEFILNPFENDQEKVEEREVQQQQKQKYMQQTEKVEAQVELQIPEQKAEEQAIQQKERNYQYPIPQQGIIVQPKIKPQFDKPQSHKREIEQPQNRESIQKSIGLIFQPWTQQNYIQPPPKSSAPFNIYKKQQVKVYPRIKPSAPPVRQAQIKRQKKKGFFDKLKQSAAKFLGVIKGDENEHNVKYKWAPMQMAAIIRHLSPQTDLLEANAERINNQKFIALPNKLITKRVRLINLSTHKWPQQVYLSKVKGDKDISLESKNVNIRLNPNQEGMIEIQMKTPKKEGLYKCIFSLKGLFPENKRIHFGELMGVQISVKKEQYGDKEQKIYEDAETLVRENLGTFEECVRSLRCNKLKIKKARKDLLLKFRK